MTQGCHLDASKAFSLSDGGDILPRQPFLRPEDWFLTESEMQASRGGVPRADLQLYTNNNSVQVFAATEELFRSMYSDISSTKANDSIYMAGWTINDISYVPDIDPSVTVKTVWEGAINRQVNFHVLMFQNLLTAKSISPIFNWVNSLEKSNAQMVLDSRVTSLSGSLHQKVTVIQTSSGQIGYIGGADIATDRWDSKYHNVSAFRKQNKIFADYNGWIDVHAKIVGPATQDMLNTFYSRWTDPSPPILTTAFKLVAGEPLDNDNIPRPFALPQKSVTQPSGTHSVQIVRTYSCQYNGYLTIAPRGETSLLAARLKAIRLARNFIYVEDQYFIHVPELLAALLDVLPSIQRLIIVTSERSSSSKATGYEKYMYDMVAPLQTKFPNKVQVYKTISSVFVHSKVVLVDDVYLAVGSANWNVRSMTSDAEVEATIVDTSTSSVADGTTVSTLARSWRIAKFGELTQFTVNFSALTIIEAANALETYTKQPNAFLLPYVLHYELYFALYSQTTKNIFDGEGRCLSQTRETCANITSNDYQVFQIACDCEKQNLELSLCPAMRTYNHAQVASDMAAARFHKILALCIVSLVFIVGLLGFMFYLIHRWYHKKNKAPKASEVNETKTSPVN